MNSRVWVRSRRWINSSHVPGYSQATQRQTELMKQDKLSSDRDFQKATVTLFFFNFFHILPRSSPMNHENVCPSYSFSCPMSRIHLGFCTFFLFEAFRPTITIVRVTSSHTQYNHHPHSCLREDISLSPYPSLGVKNDPGNCCSSTRHFE